MKRHVILLSFLAIAIVLCVAVKAPAQLAGRQIVCPGDPIPVGWIKVDERIDATACDAGLVWVLETFINKAPGSAMVICADQPTPGGWETLGVASSSNQCGGTDATGSNIKSIRRVA
jgi:hypothetical protein